MQLMYHKLYPDVPDLTFGTEQSACFDLRVYLNPGLEYTTFEPNNYSYTNQLWSDIFWLEPRHRYLLPTGIIFDIPPGHSVRIHPRSSMSGKFGIVNPNLEGVIDSDYFHECKMLVLNMSDIRVQIKNGDRILQAEMVPVLSYTLTATEEVPQPKTNRIGGFGSTGTN